MASIKYQRDASLLIQPADLIGRLEAKTIVTIVDVRSPKPWARSDVKIRGAVRIDPERLPLDPTWRKDMLLVFY